MEPGTGEFAPANIRESAPPVAPSTKADAATILALLALVVALALVLAWPWIPLDYFSAADRMRFQPLAHGQSATRVTLSSDGSPVAWTTESAIAIPAWEVFGGVLPESLPEHILNVLPELGTDGQYPPGTALFRMHTRTIGVTGAVTLVLP